MPRVIGPLAVGEPKVKVTAGDVLVACMGGRVTVGMGVEVRDTISVSVADGMKVAVNVDVAGGVCVGVED